LGTFFPVGQPDGTTYKVGDNSYGVFLNDIRTNPSQGSGGGLFSNIASSALSMIGLSNAKPFGQLLKDEYHANTKGQNYDANGNYYSLKVHKDRNNYSPIDNKSVTQYTVEENSLLKNKLSSSFRNSNNSTIYPSAFNDPTDPNVQDTRQQLESLLTVIKNKGQYQVSMTYNNFLAESYNDLINVKDKGDGLYVGQNGNSPVNYFTGLFLKSKGNLKTYSKNIKNSGSKTLVDLGMDTNTPDTINQLNVLSPDNFYINGGTNNSEKSTGYSPYEDDVIAFYFHDLVNDKYIPFRATIKSLQESLSAEWSDIKYINRADKSYSYGGFERTLGFNFNVVMSSIKELAPTWQRINYLAGLVKPANYTNGTVYSRFIIPPLTQFTIGDMYKNQPAVITQVGISIPENAVWETLGEFYGNNNYNWAYLSNTVTWLNSAGLYAQFPNECEITIQMKLLEKELPHTGGSNYGDFYRDVSQRNPIGTSKYGSFSSRLEPTSNTGTPMVEYASTITGGSSQ
jgi:hypothetical protein